MTDEIEFVARSIYTDEMARNRDGDVHHEWETAGDLVQSSFRQLAESAINAVKRFNSKHPPRMVGAESERRGGHEAEPQDEDD